MNINNLIINDKWYFDCDEGNHSILINLIKPKEYAILKYVAEIDFLKRFSENDIEEYLNNSLPHHRINNINGISLGDIEDDNSIVLCVECEEDSCFDEYYTNNEKIYCSGCFNEINHKSDYKLFEFPHFYDQTNFGSLLDWIPIYEDIDGNMILQNLNIDSKFLYKYATVSFDDHGRFGIYVLPEENINDILLKLKNYEEKRLIVISKFGKNSWENFNAMPIKQLMIEHNFDVYYG